MKIWKIVNNQIRPTDKQIPCPQAPHLCHWLQNGEKVTIWWGDNNNKDSNNKKFKSSDGHTKHQCRSEVSNRAFDRYIISNVMLLVSTICLSIDLGFGPLAAY